MQQNSRFCAGAILECRKRAGSTAVEPDQFRRGGTGRTPSRSSLVRGLLSNRPSSSTMARLRASARPVLGVRNIGPPDWKSVVTRMPRASPLAANQDGCEPPQPPRLELAELGAGPLTPRAVGPALGANELPNRISPPCTFRPGASSTTGSRGPLPFATRTFDCRCCLPRLGMRPRGRMVLGGPRALHLARSSRIENGVPGFQ